MEQKLEEQLKLLNQSEITALLRTQVHIIITPIRGEHEFPGVVNVNAGR